MKHWTIIILYFVGGASLLAQKGRDVDFISVDATVVPDAITKSVEGTCAFEFRVVNLVDTIRIDARKMAFSQVKINGRPAQYKVSDKELLLYSGYKRGKNTLTLSYSATPSQTLYFTGSGEDLQFWTQGQGKYTSHWLPSFDDTNEKLVFNISVRFARGFEVIGNGMLKSRQSAGEIDQWRFEMEKPMSSYLAMIAGGKFRSKTTQSASGVPLIAYIRPEDSLRFEPTYRFSRQMFDFLEREIGVPYPWKVYRQVPVRDFLYAGMENTAATVFAQELVVDSIAFNDKNYVNVNAHELAHQWFGNLVTAKSGEHHWLQEGFATYYALLAERDIYGDDHFYLKLHEMASNLRQAAIRDTIPLMSTRASSLTYYQKGAWALHVLKETIGEEPFRRSVKNYLDRHRFGNVETSDFLREAEAVSGKSLSDFERGWLRESGFRFEQAVVLLKRNRFMQRYFDLLDLAAMPLEGKKDRLMQIILADEFHPLKEEAVQQLEDAPFDQKEDLIRAAMKAGPHTRQAVARTLASFPQSFVEDYRTLLDDPSYITQEIALNVLWSQFPLKRGELLQHTRGRVGFNDRNLEVQWLTLALLTEGFDAEHKVEYYDRLIALGRPGQESTTRMNAINNLLYLNPTDKNVLALLPATLVHHKWQLTAFGREKIRALLKNPNARVYFEELLPDLSNSEKAQLTRMLTEK